MDLNNYSEYKDVSGAIRVSLNSRASGIDKFQQIDKFTFADG